MRDDGIPFGITLLALRVDRTLYLASIGRVFHADTDLPMGALNTPSACAYRCFQRRRSGDEISIAAVGAHLSGMPLNGELKG